MSNLLKDIQTDLNQFFPSKRGSFASRTACNKYLNESMEESKPYKILKVIWEHYENRRAKTDKSKIGPINWILRKQLAHRYGRNNLEIPVERSIARLDGWYNQIPTASGLFFPDQRRACIDLAYCPVNSRLIEFVELKIDADNPLYACLEHIAYAVLWLYSRVHASTLGYQECGKFRDALECDEVKWVVLAPTEFFRYRIRGQEDSSTFSHLLDFSEKVSAALSKFAGEKTCNQIKATFSFQEFERQLITAENIDANSIVSDRKPASL